MKQEFDRLEQFRMMLNAQAKICCNVGEAYDREKAADFLQQLTQSWKMGENDVIATITKEVLDIVDKKTCYYVVQFLRLQQISFNEAEVKQRWNTLSGKEKNEIANDVLAYMQGLKKQD